MAMPIKKNPNLKNSSYWVIYIGKNFNLVCRPERCCQATLRRRLRPTVNRGPAKAKRKINTIMHGSPLNDLFVPEKEEGQRSSFEHTDSDEPRCRPTLWLENDPRKGGWQTRHIAADGVQWSLVIFLVYTVQLWVRTTVARHPKMNMYTKSAVLPRKEP